MRNTSKRLVMIVEDIYEPLTTTELNRGLLPKIKYYKGVMGEMSKEEAEPYLASGAAIPITNAMRKRFVRALIKLIEARPLSD